MFDHVTIRAADFPASARFYKTVLAALAIPLELELADFLEWDDFGIVAASPEHPGTRNLHIGFVAPSREAVNEFWRAGTEAGHASDGAPGLRPDYKPDYYGAFLLDPAGNSVEAVHYPGPMSEGNVDHLWIRVADLEAAERFYGVIAAPAGLDPGSRWETGVALRRASATLALVADGRPLTEDLHVAFPAPDQETVRRFYAAAASAGYEGNGEPGDRPQYHPGYYGAFVLDPAGTNVEVVFHSRI